MDELRSRFAVTQNDRANADWYNIDVGGTFSLGPFSVDIGNGVNLTDLNQFNRALVDARRHRNCEFYIGSWDQNGCGIGPY